MSHDPEEQKQMLEFQKRCSEIAPNDDDAMEALLDEMPEFEIPEKPPLFKIVADPDLLFSEFQERVSGHLDLEHEGQNLLFPAIKSGQLDRVKWLVENGIDPHKVCKHGYNPVSIALHGKCENLDEIANYLIDLGADLNQQSDWGESPIKYPIYWGQYHVVHELIRRGANPEWVGFTPLHQAASAGDLETIDQLATPTTLEFEKILGNGRHGLLR